MSGRLGRLAAWLLPVVAFVHMQSAESVLLRLMMDLKVPTTSGAL